MRTGTAGPEASGLPTGGAAAGAADTAGRAGNEPLDQLFRRSLERELGHAQAVALGKFRDVYAGLAGGLAQYLLALVACGLGTAFVALGAVWGLGELFGERYWLSLLVVGAVLLASAAVTLVTQRRRIGDAAAAAERRARSLRV